MTKEEFTLILGLLKDNPEMLDKLLDRLMPLMELAVKELVEGMLKKV